MPHQNAGKGKSVSIVFRAAFADPAGAAVRLGRAWTRCAAELFWPNCTCAACFQLVRGTACHQAFEGCGDQQTIVLASLLGPVLLSVVVYWTGKAASCTSYASTCVCCPIRFAGRQILQQDNMLDNVSFVTRIMALQGLQQAAALSSVPPTKQHSSRRRLACRWPSQRACEPVQTLARMRHPPSPLQLWAHPPQWMRLWGPCPPPQHTQWVSRHRQARV